MKGKDIKSIEDLLKVYKEDLSSIAGKSSKSDRATGGVQRSLKGKLVEFLACEIIKKAWSEVGGRTKDLEVLKNRKVKVALKGGYLKMIKDREIAKHIESSLSDYTYSFQVDVSVRIKGKLVMAAECKAYTENAMLKRVLFDGALVKENFPDADIVLFQLESQLGGDYSEIFKEKHFGSKSSHTLMSYFDYELNIITLLEKDRKVDRPIHKKDYFKEMQKESLEKALFFFKQHLEKHLS